MRRVNFFLVFALTCLCVPRSAFAQAPKPNEVVSHAFRPEHREFSDERLKQLKVPAGFKVNVFSKGLGNARMMAVADDATVYVTRMKEGKVTMLRDENADGVADKQKDTDLKDVHGITIHNGQMYLATVKELYRSKIQPDGSLVKPEKIGGELPDGGQHPRRTIGFGPDGMLYISIGSTCNNCEESNPEHATMLRAEADGSKRSIFAKGLRNTIGFAWHPQTRELWGMDHGSDDRGDDLPPEELNRLIEGGDYGWPFCYGNKEVDPIANEPREGAKKERCASSVAPVLTYQAHSAPIGFIFYTGSQFPREFQGDAFAAMRGSWNRNPATGYKVVRIRFENGKPTKFEDFLTGFLIENGQAHFGRIAGLATAKDGSLLVSEDTNGIIYRIAYQSAGTR